MLRRIVPALGLVVVITGAVLAAGPAATAQNNSEQIVFSGTGGGDFGAFGFWIWCEIESNNSYAGKCSGSTYFYDLGIVRHVIGVVSEPEEGEYQMDVASSRDDSVSCTLTNVPPIVRGPHNTVNASCTAPVGNGTSTNAVVKATGPG